MTDTQQVERIVSPALGLALLRELSARLRELRAQQAQALDARDRALVHIRGLGASLDELAEASGLTDGRVAQVISAARDAEPPA